LLVQLGLLGLRQRVLSVPRVGKVLKALLVARKHLVLLGRLALRVLAGVSLVLVARLVRLALMRLPVQRV